MAYYLWKCIWIEDTQRKKKKLFVLKIQNEKKVEKVALKKEPKENQL